ncbi:MAG TPA: hypothetical protein EYH34_00320, partial [Planctomycetes bacterium]|nr:hypothetical protein [Planctomycetota bacterium]
MTVGTPGGQPQPEVTGSVPEPGDVVRIDLASGRRLVAALDRRTDGQRLWARIDLPSGFLLRPIRWNRVVRVQWDGRAMGPEELREAISRWPPAAAVEVTRP